MARELVVEAEPAAGMSDQDGPAPGGWVQEGGGHAPATGGHIGAVGGSSGFRLRTCLFSITSSSWCCCSCWMPNSTKASVGFRSGLLSQELGPWPRRRGAR